MTKSTLQVGAAGFLLFQPIFSENSNKKFDENNEITSNSGFKITNWEFNSLLLCKKNKKYKSNMI